MAYLDSKPRYEILDGLRGVAAMVVVAFHLFETYSKGPTEQIINHGYLAVDFFFVLSGYVIGYAYDDRWGRMTTLDFFKRRITRLHPMVIMGCVLGALLYYFGDNMFPLIKTIDVWKVMLTFLAGCLMIPIFPFWDIRGWGEFNPLNGPQWSLTWEYFANILYALVIRRFSKVALMVFVGLSALLTIDVAMNFDVWGVLKARDYAAYTLIGGWSLTPDQLYIGISRLLYPFFMGLLLSRLGHKISIRGGFWWCSFLVVLILAIPCVGKEEFGWVNGLYCTISVLLLFPLIVLMGAGSPISGKRSVAWCKWLGAISYPLYITHYPLIYMQMDWAATHKDLPLSVHIFVGVSIFFLSIGMAYASLRLYDEPVREWLKKHWLQRK